MTARRHFLHCRDCGEVFRPSPYDRAPEFARPDDEHDGLPRDDAARFLGRHAAHAIETLQPTGQVATPEGPLWDPMAPLYWEVSNGSALMLVRAGRDHIAEPLRYRVLPGRLVLERRMVEVPQAEVAAEVDRALFPGVAPQRKLDAFVTAFAAVVAETDPETLELLYDVPCDPALSVAKLPATALERVAAHARRIFDSGAAERLAARVQASGDDPDAFSVLVRQPIRVDIAG